MTRIRIQNDITLRVTVTRLGEAEDFSGKTVRLLLRSAVATVELPFTADGNTLTALWKGTEQTKCGTYSVTVVEDWGDGSRNTADCCHALTLVSHSCACALTGGQTVETTVDVGTSTEDVDISVQVPSNGLSAYEIACLNGFEGTEQEWLASLQGSGLQLGETSDTAFAGDRGVALEEQVAEILAMLDGVDIGTATDSDIDGLFTAATQEEVDALFE